MATYRERAETVTPRFDAVHRQKLVASLRQYLQDIGASPKALEANERLLLEDSVAVITGQQAGLFGGPLFTIYKAISAVGIAARLERELKRPVVPVFWIASEDHDFAEVNHAYVLDKDDDVRRIRLPNAVEPHRMVYHTSLTRDDALHVLGQARSTLGDGPYLAELLRVYEETFVEGESLAKWFARILAYLTEDMGLVILDPCLPALRELVGPVWTSVIKERESIAHHLAKVYAEVDEAGFAPEVLRDELNSTLFYVSDGQRYVLERTGGQRLRARTLLEEKTVLEWIELAEKDPTAFSSNVLCRPVVQDHLLPTLAYIGGPSEIAYHPLSRGVFHALGRTLPPLLLRQRVTLLTSSVRRQMEKWHVSSEAIIEQQSLVDPMLAQHGKDEVDALFEVLGAEAEGRWNGIAARFESCGPQVADIMRRQMLRDLEGMQRVRRKLSRLIELRHDDSVRQLRHIERWLWTDGHLQERRLSLLPFWAKYSTLWISGLPKWDGYDNPGAVYLVSL